MTGNAHWLFLRALLCFSFVAGIALTGCFAGGDPVAALDSSSPTPPGKFISTWKIPSSNLDIVLPLREGYDYDFVVHWGDGNSSEVNAHNDPDARHIYKAAGDYTITIVGTLEAWYFNNIDSENKGKIIAVDDFGRMGWKNLKAAFHGCSNLTTFKGGDVSQVTNMSGMFLSASSLVELDTSNWDVSSVENMSTMFSNAGSLVELDTSNWDVSSVTDMSGMFNNASSLEQLDTSNWDVSSVENMSTMFHNTTSLVSLDLSNWDFDSVTDMSFIFSSANGLTTESYSDMLMRIVDTSTSKNPITLDGGSAKYNDCGAKARAILITAPRNWTINDGGAQDGGADAARCID